MNVWLTGPLEALHSQIAKQHVYIVYIYFEINFNKFKGTVTFYVFEIKMIHACFSKRLGLPFFESDSFIVFFLVALQIRLTDHNDVK